MHGDTRRRTAVYGGSFDPPHVGHVLAVAYALSTGEVDEVLVVPCFHHPFAKSLAPFDARVEMVEAAMAPLRRVEVSRVEEVLGGESRTLRTVQHLRAEDPSRSLRLLIGSDILADAPKWHGFADVVALAPLLVLGRVGFVRDDAPPPVLPDVSSTRVRAAVPAGRDMSALVPARVLEIIRREGLYKGAP
ncbi:MAG: nicotinate-nicotinamide nucleotide adenylyltransferase [Polyangiaceae bacterium]|nr:nicotinate-nicotinamide nucleotide adenylyltransferase [Polyangiaceae bacterium]